MKVVKKIVVGVFVAAMLATPVLAVQVNVQRATNFSVSGLEKLNKSAVLLNQVVNSAEFKDRIINFSYNGKREFVQNNGLTNEQIYDQVMKAAEIHPVVTQPNGLMDMSLDIYYPRWRWSSAKAYTSTGDSVLHINGYYFPGALLSELSNTMVHEWLHKLGFDHDYKSTTRRPYSVPYGIGNMVEQLAAKINPSK